MVLLLLLIIVYHISYLVTSRPKAVAAIIALTNAIVVLLGNIAI
jgi:hypothetical protein